MSLIDELKSVRDRRTQPRYPQWVVLALLIMGTMSKCYGYRSLSRFTKRYEADFLELMELPYERLPCRSTIRNVMLHLDYEALTQAFNRWAISSGAIADSPELQQLATDGKAIKASLSNYSKSYQNFVSVVSMYNVATGQVVALAPMQNKHTSEVVVVRQLIEQLELTGLCISLDALHAKKNDGVNR